MKKRLVVIGNGMAGARFVEEVLVGGAEIAANSGQSGAAVSHSSG